MTDEQELAELIEQRFEKEGLDDHEPTFAAIAAEVAHQYYAEKMIQPHQVENHLLIVVAEDLEKARERIAELTSAQTEYEETILRGHAQYEEQVRHIEELTSALEEISRVGGRWSESIDSTNDAIKIARAALEKGK